MDQNWTAQDQGLLEALQLLDHLRRYNQFPPSSINSSPLPLEQGETTLRVISARTLTWHKKIKVQPQEYHYFRIKVKWAKDPLMAPFLWLLFLPFNIISMLIARPPTTKDHDRWEEIGRGPLAITDRAIIHTRPGEWVPLKIYWSSVTAVGFTASPVEIRLTTLGDQRILIYVPEEARLWVYIASRYLAFNDSTVELPRPADFINRARHLGYLP
jgi:hypothetical protein